MKVHLLYENTDVRSRDFNMNKSDLIQDLNLEIIFKTMAKNDKFIYQTVRSVMVNPSSDIRTVLHRQGILGDFIRRYDDLYKVYEISANTLETISRYTETMKKSPSITLSNAANVLHSLKMLEILVESLEKLKMYLDTIEMNFQSGGMKAFYEHLMSDYNYTFVEKVKECINDMNAFTEGGEITFSATVGQGLKVKDMFVNSLVKTKVTGKKKGAVTLLWNKLFKKNLIPLDDSELEQDVRDFEASCLLGILKMYQKFIKELEVFFENLHYQSAFYVGAASLCIRLKQLCIPVSVPIISKKEIDMFKFKGLYDMSLAIYSHTMPVPNDLSTEDRKLIIITGANQGGKSTYLRSIGIAQLLMQNGMFVPADYYCNILYDGIFSHFTRREDAAMNSGKLDEELSRMNRILMSITPNSLLLMNESFSTTTEREGSKISQDVVRALYENNTKIIMVTHLFEFTKTMFEKKLPQAIFLSAERLPDGRRTFRIYEREPERTSYGLDLYEDIICG